MAKAKKSPAAKATKAKTAVKKTPPVKKTAAKKAPTALPWSTIHVFGYGESQIIGNEHKGKTQNIGLKNISPLLEHLSKKGAKLQEETLHALNIFNGMFADVHDKVHGSKRIAWADIDHKLINKLADELKTKISHRTGNNKVSTSQKEILKNSDQFYKSEAGKRLKALLLERKNAIIQANK